MKYFYSWKIVSWQSLLIFCLSLLASKVFNNNYRSIVISEVIIVYAVANFSKTQFWFFPKIFLDNWKLVCRCDVGYVTLIVKISVCYSISQHGNVLPMFNNQISSPCIINSKTSIRYLKVLKSIRDYRILKRNTIVIREHRVYLIIMIMRILSCAFAVSSKIASVTCLL